MGSCFSSDFESIDSIVAAKVISITGNLREYSNYTTVSQVLESEPSSSFLCNSDHLYYDEFIQALDSDEFLQVGQIYFVLPKARLQHRLTAPDMAALAVKASSALMRGSKKSGGGSGRGRKIRISPVLEVNQKVGGNGFDGLVTKRFDEKKTSSSIVMNRSGSVKKLHRSASRRARIVYRSFKMRLSTIHEFEGSVAEQ